MGYPWPRHGCFPRGPQEEAQPVDDFFLWLPKSDEFVLVLVKSAKAGVLVLADGDGVESIWGTHVRCGFLRGGIVAFSKKKKLVLDWDADSYPVEGPLAACPHCTRFLFPESMEAHIQEEHPGRTCHLCGEWVRYRDWLEHQAKHLEPEIPSS